MKKLFEGFRRFVNEGTSSELTQKARVWGVDDPHQDPGFYEDLLGEVYAAYSSLLKMAHPELKSALEATLKIIDSEKNRTWSAQDINSVIMSASRIVPSGRGATHLFATPLAQEMNLETIAGQQSAIPDDDDDL